MQSNSNSIITNEWNVPKYLLKVEKNKEFNSLRESLLFQINLYHFHDNYFKLFLKSSLCLQIIHIFFRINLYLYPTFCNFLYDVRKPKFGSNNLENILHFFNLRPIPNNYSDSFESNTIYSNSDTNKEQLIKDMNDFYILYVNKMNDIHLTISNLFLQINNEFPLKIKEFEFLNIDSCTHKYNLLLNLKFLKENVLPSFVYSFYPRLDLVNEYKSNADFFFKMEYFFWSIIDEFEILLHNHNKLKYVLH